MRLLFEAGQTTSELELQPGNWTVGGAEEDGVRLAALPPGLIALELTDTSVWLRSARDLRVGRAPLGAGTRRLLLSGEAVEMAPGIRLRRPPQGMPTATVALLQSWIRDRGPGARSAAAELVCVAGPDAPSAFPVTGTQIELGRHPACGVQLRDPSISRRQARLVRAGTAHRLEDLGGPNPTRRNGRRLRAPAVLEDGDVIELGRTLLCYLAAEVDSTAAEAPASGLTVRAVPADLQPAVVPAHRTAVQNARRPRARASRRPGSLLLVVLLGLLCGGTFGWLVLSASATAQPAPPP